MSSSPEQEGDNNYHAVLGVAHDDELDTIKAAYRRLALIKHPDKNGNTPESTLAFREVCRLKPSKTLPSPSFT
jgi:DnaJ-class molecular chaperone